MQWKTARDDSLSSRITRGGLHSISDVSHLESKIVVLENMLKGLSPQMPQISQASTVSCSHCQKGIPVHKHPAFTQGPGKGRTPRGEL